MSISDKIGRLETSWSRLSLVAQILIPASLLTGLTTYLSIEADYPPIAIIFTVIGMFSVVTILFTSVETRRSWPAVAGIIVICTAMYGYAMYFQHQLEATQKRIEDARKEDYLLPYAGWAPDIEIDPAAPQPNFSVMGGRISLTFDNDNNFPIYIRSIRRQSAIDDVTSGDPQEVSETTALPNSNDLRIADSPITIKPSKLFKNGFSATVDFFICYGREKRRMNKAFFAKGTLVFLSNPRGGFYAPDYHPSDDAPLGFGYIDCPDNLSR